MTSVFAFKVKDELIMSYEDGKFPLTKKLNIWQNLKTKWADNIMITGMDFTYESRAGPLATGVITANITDNRIDSDMNNNVIKSISFKVNQDFFYSCDYNVNFYLSDLSHPQREPLLLTTSISDCSILPGFSIGQIRVKIEVTTSSNMIRRISKNPVMRLFRDNALTSSANSRRRVSLEDIKMEGNKPLTIKSGDEGVGNSINRSNSAMVIPRKKYIVSESAKEY
ncbi:TPA_asm: P3 [Medicago alphacytorhabdovirus 1]|nr:TPA_asm: P3 [Medicago alphacytorhabdovirus 1]